MTDDRLDAALDRVANDSSPLPEASNLEPEDQRMLQMAQLIRGATDSVPAPQFVDHVRALLASGPRRVSRRSAFVSGVGALAAGVAAGFGLDRLVTQPRSHRLPPLVGAHGRWVSVAQLADLPEGGVAAFSSGPLRGFMVNHHGEVRAVSRICTHMGCALDFQRSEQAFVCPCHGAEFNLNGAFRYGVSRYPSLPPLPKIRSRVVGDSIEIWTV